MFLEIEYLGQGLCTFLRLLVSSAEKFYLGDGQFLKWKIDFSVKHMGHILLLKVLVNTLSQMRPWRSISLEQGLVNDTLQAKSSLPPVFINIYWNTATLIHLCTAYAVCPAMAESGGCDRDCMAYKAWSTRPLTEKFCWPCCGGWATH